MEINSNPTANRLHRSNYCELLRTINTVTASIHRSAFSESQVLEAFKEQMGLLELPAAILLSEDSGSRFIFQAATWLDATLESLINQELKEFNFLAAAVPIFQQVLKTEQGVFIPDARTAIPIVEAIPARLFTASALKAMSEQPGIIAPLKVGTEPGLLLVYGPGISARDLPVFKIFADHLGISLDNARHFSAIRKAEARYHSLVENSLTGIFLVDPQTAQVLSVNRQFFQWTGFSKADWTGLDFVALHAPGFQAQARQVFQEICEAGQKIYEAPFCRKDGSEWQAQIAASLVQADGQWLLQGVVQDLAPIQDTRQALRESEERLRTLIDAMPDIVGFKDGEGRWLEANQADLEMFEIAGVEDSLRRRADELAALHAISINLNSEKDLHGLLQSIIEQATQLLNASGGGFYLCNPLARELELAVAFKVNTAYIGTRIHYGEGAAGRIADSGHPLIVDDYLTWPGRAQAYDGEKTFRAVAGVPVTWQGQVTGVIVVLSINQRRLFNSEELELLSLFANQAAAAIENARLFQSERRRRQEAETLRQATSGLGSTLKLSDLLNNILTHLAKIVPYDSATVFLLEGGHLHAVTARGFPDLPALLARDFNTDNDLFKQIQITRRSIIINDVQSDPRFENWAGTEYVRSWMGIPLLERGEVIGYMTCDNRQAGFYKPADASLAEAFISQAAMAIENARLFEAEQRRAAELEAVHQVTLSLTASLELPQVLIAILRGAMSLLPGANNSHIFLYNSESGLLAFGASLWSEGVQGRTWSQPRQNGLTYSVARSGDPIVIPDLRAHPLYQNTPEDWNGAIVGLPLKIGQRVVGVMIVSYPAPREFVDNELGVLRLLGDQAAIAIENGRLFEQAATERRHLRLLYDINRELATSLDPDEILNRAVSLSCQALGGLASSAFIYVTEEDRLSLRALHGSKNTHPIEKLDNFLKLRPGHGLVGWVAQTREAAYIPDVAFDEHWLPFPEIDGDAQSVICTPILSGKHLLGVISVLHHQKNTFSREHLDLMQAICQEVGLALSNASRYQQVQRRLVEITLIQRLIQTFNQRLEVRVLLEEVAVQLAEHFGYTLTCIFMIEGDQLAMKAYHGPRPPRDTYPLEKGIIGRVARTGQVAWVPDVTLDPDYEPCIADTIAELAVPIFRGDLVIGVIDVESSRSSQISLQDRDLLLVLAGQIGVALENASLYERVRRHADELEDIIAQRTAELTELYQLSQEIGYQLSFESLLHLLLSHLRNATRCEVAMGYLAGKNARLLVIETNRQLTPEQITELKNFWQQAMAARGELAEETSLIQPQILPAGNLEANTPAWLDEIVSTIEAPVIVDGRQTGYLFLASERRAAFGTEQARLLTTFANQAAATMQRLETVLQAQQRHLESLVEHMPVGTVLLDAAFNLLVANSLGREILYLLDPGSPNGALTRLGEYGLTDLIAHQDDPLPMEVFYPGPPRRVFGVQFHSVTGLRGESDSRQWVLTIREITQEREIQLRIQSQERLATVGQLAAGIAHDFNNIMAAILVYADLLQSDPAVSSTSRDKLATIQQQVQRAASLIRQILDFSRRSIMDQSNLDLLSFIKELDKMLRRVLPETIRLELTYQPGAYWVKADPTRLQQVFINLALNARDAMPHGGILRFKLEHLHLKLSERAPFPSMKPGLYVQIIVADTGCGIDPEARQHIFEPFFTTKPAGQGTGLGLAQVYGIIKQHDGFIDLRSEVGQGACFVIYLPEQSEPLDDRFFSADPTRLDGRGAVALVVEDDRTTREALKALLEANNYSVTTAGNGIEALECFKPDHEDIELVVSDIVMPEMGGMALHQALQATHPEIKILFITGHPLENENQALLEKGQVHWLQKPFSVQEFNQAVYDLFRAA